MRDYTGTPFASLPDPSAPDFSGRLRNVLGTFDAWARDASQAVALLQKGQVPQGQGVTLGSTSLTTESDAFLRSGDGFVDLTTDQTINGVKDFETQIVVGGTSDANLLIGDTSFGADSIKLIIRAAAGGLQDLTDWYLPSGSLAASMDVNGTLTLAGQLNTTSGGNLGAAIFLSDGVQNSLPLKYTVSGNVGFLSWTGIGSGATLQLPIATGNLLSDNNSSSVSNKTLDNSNVAKCDTTTGFTFQDQSITSKQLRFNLSGISSSTTIAHKIADTSGTAVVVGNTTSAANVLGAVSLTGQTASLGSQTLLTGGASSAGVYRVSFYVVTTTGGDPGDTLIIDLLWNDGTSTLDEVVGFLGPTSSSTLYDQHDLENVNYVSHASIVVRSAASQNITFTTTLTSPGAGTPAYSLYARIEALD